MKKGMQGAISLGILLMSTNIALAGFNPYADVNKSEWSYGAVEGLIRQGLVSGCDEEDFHNLKRWTRYDLAVYIAQAMSRRDEADVNTRNVIEKLAKEYAHELKVIGVEDEIFEHETETPETPELNEQTEEKPAGIKKLERFEFEGDGRLRYDGGYTSGDTMSRGKKRGTYSPNDHINIDLRYSYKINDNWKLRGESEWGHNLNDQTHSQTLQNSVFSKMFLEGNFDNFKVVAGRYGRYSPFGIHYDEKINGLALTFGNQLKATAEFGRVVAADERSQPDYSPFVYRSPQYQAFLLETPIEKNTKLHLQYYRIGGNVYQTQLPSQHVNYYLAAFESQFDKNVKAEIGFVHSDADSFTNTEINVRSKKNNAYFAKIAYKKADHNIAGSYGLYAFYRYSPQLASYSNADDWMRNVRGVRIGFDYIFQKDMGFNCYYTFGRDIDTGNRNDAYRFQWNFWI